MAPPQMLGGERAESSDEDGDDDDDDDDDDDEFEDSEPTEATATEVESLGDELSATPSRAAIAVDKWVAVKGQAPLHHPSSPPPPPSPQQMLPGAVAEAVSALSR